MPGGHINDPSLGIILFSFVRSINFLVSVLDSWKAFEPRMLRVHNILAFEPKRRLNLALTLMHCFWNYKETRVCKQGVHETLSQANVSRTIDTHLDYVSAKKTNKLQLVIDCKKPTEYDWVSDLTDLKDWSSTLSTKNSRLTSIWTNLEKMQPQLVGTTPWICWRVSFQTWV